MDAIEKLGAKFGKWYEGLFGAGSSELHPKDVLRRITQAIEDGRREGVDGKVYVPNQFTLELSVPDADERDYLRSFLDEDELRAVLSRYLKQHSYATRGPLTFAVVDAESADAVPHKLRVKARFAASPAGGVPQGGQNPSPQEGPPALLPAAEALRAGPIMGSREGEEGRKSSSRQTWGAGGASLSAETDDDADPLTVAAVSYGSLIITGPDGQTRPFPLNKPVVTIGRARVSDISLPQDEQVSRAHARLERGGDGTWTVTDLNSTNGVLVGTVRVIGTRALLNGDTVWIGSTRIMLQTADARPAPRPESLAPRPRLVAGNGTEHILASETLIGRAVTSDIVLIDPSVSQRHARIVCPDPSQCYLEDVGSANGTAVNGLLLPPGERLLLRAGDILLLGAVELTFSVPSPEN